MKISELITILQQKDPNLLVMVEGYEGGLSDIEEKKIEETSVYMEGYHDWQYYGNHEERDEDLCLDRDEQEEKEYREKYPLVQALIFRR